MEEEENEVLPLVIDINSEDDDHETENMVLTSGIDTSQISNKSNGQGNIKEKKKKSIKSRTVKANDSTKKIKKVKGHKQKKKKHSSSKGDQFYKRKFRRLSRRIKDMMHENVAFADEITRLQKRLSDYQHDRKYLLKRLFQYKVGRLDQSDGMSAANLPFNVHASTVLPDEFISPYMAQIFLGTDVSKSALPVPPVKTRGKRKVKKLTLEDINNVLLKSSKNKKKKAKSTVKVTIEPIPLDASGKPIIPIVLDDLRVHSLGRIIYDKDYYHSEMYIYPVGYCSSRVYNSVKNPIENISYMCTITEGDAEPKFEVSLEDEPDVVFQASSADSCVEKINKTITDEIEMSQITECNFKPMNGSNFFGFSVPVIQNLIQNCPGAKKCSKYTWVKFEVKKKLNRPQVKEVKDDSIKDEIVNVKSEVMQVDSSQTQDEANTETEKIEESSLDNTLDNTMDTIDTKELDSNESDKDQLMIEMDLP